MTPNSAAIAAGKSDSATAADPVLQSSYVMQTPSYIAGLFTPQAPKN